MSVSDGQVANQTTFNNAFWSRTIDTTTIGKVKLNNAAAASGSAIINIQRELNAIASFLGNPINQVKDVKPVWTDTSLGTPTDDVFERLQAVNLALADLIANPPASGGGGGSLAWVESLDAPESAVDFENAVYKFEAGLIQALYALISVPATYLAGDPIAIKILPYSKDTATATLLMQAVATLNRTGTDARSDTTNQMTSTNTAIATSAALVDVSRAVLLDITDAGGLVNGVAVSPGDTIQVKLTRGTDTSTEVAYVPVYGSEVSFQ